MARKSEAGEPVTGLWKEDAPMRFQLAQRQRRRDRTQTDTERLFDHLHRGGEYAHLWTDAGHQSYWFGVQRGANLVVRTIPRQWLRHNVYFTVHPLSQIPPHNMSGNTDPRYIGSQLAYITAVNALFAEYDGKDYVEPAEYLPHLPATFGLLTYIQRQSAIQTVKEQLFYADPAPYQQRARAVIDALYYPPSVMVASGGGYHCYWLLRDTVPVDEANRADVQAIQHHWVQLVQADPGAADLRRLLRVPGTYNMKAGFGRQHPRVDFCQADFTLLYAYPELEEVVNDWLFANRPQQTNSTPKWRRPRVAADDNLRATFNQQHSLVELLTQHGYQISYHGPTLTRLARPGRERQQSSVTVFAARADGTPELAVHFSTNDPLYSELTVDPASGQTRRQVRDAYATYLMLTRFGDW
jgi:hypothetical protein